MAPINRRPYWNDEYIPGRHHQSWSPNDDYYHIRGGGSSKSVVVKFTLTGNLTTTGTAEVDTTSDPTVADVGATITLTNPSEQNAYTGATGTAVSYNSGTTWFVIEVNRRPNSYIIALTCDSHAWSGVSDTNQGFAADRTSPITFTTELSIGSFPLVHTHASPPTITNPHNLCWKSGDKALVERNSESEYRIVKILRANCTRFRFALTANAPTGLTPTLTATSICPLDGESGEPPSGTLSIVDRYGKAHNAKSGMTGVACYDFNRQEYFVEECQHIATRFIGTLQATLSGSAANISVTPVSALNGILPSGTQTVKNTYTWSDGTTGHKIAVEWNPHLGQWETYQMRCPS